jgi:hypothetical protein
MTHAQEKAREIIGSLFVAKGQVPFWHTKSPEGKAVRAITAALEQARDEALEEAAEKSLELGKSVNGGYNNAAFQIAEGIRALMKRGGKEFEG